MECAEEASLQRGDSAKPNPKGGASIRERVETCNITFSRRQLNDYHFTEIQWFYIWGSTPDPAAKPHKKSIALWNSCGCFIKCNFPNPSRFLAFTSPRCGSCARTPCVLRDYPPIHFVHLRRMCPASSKRAGFRGLRGYKPLLFSTTEYTETRFARHGNGLESTLRVI